VEQITANPHSANNGLTQVPLRALRPTETAAATEAGSASDHDPRGHVTGQPAPPIGHAQSGCPLVRPFPEYFYRPRFLVLPTGRTIFAWGIWDCQKNSGPIPNRIFKMSEFVHRTRSLGKAYAFARRLNEKHEQKVAA
jgi:hypothetical protein